MVRNFEKKYINCTIGLNHFLTSYSYRMYNGLLNSPLLVTVICLILIFALLSLLVSTLTEAVNSYFQERGHLLQTTIGQLFNDGLNPNFGHLLYNHPIIKNLKKDKNSLPQYISAEMFGNVLIDTVNNSARKYVFDSDKNAIVALTDTRSPFEKFQAAVHQMYHTEVKLLLLNMVERCQYAKLENPLLALERELQQWYNDQMDRTSGWYKTKMRNRLFWIALLVALGLNIDSIHLFQTLYRSPDLRAKLEPIAEDVAAQYADLKTDTGMTDLQRAYKAVDMSKLLRDSVHKDTFLTKVSLTLSSMAKIDSLSHRHDSMHNQAFQRAADQIDEISSLGLPIGWRKDLPPISWSADTSARNNNYFDHHKKWSPGNLVVYILGILITAFSLSAGAPFWFDLLLKLVNIRRTGSKPSTT
jgi:hypothetical protein